MVVGWKITIFPWFSHSFPMVFPRFSHGFPTVSYGFVGQITMSLGALACSLSHRWQKCMENLDVSNSLAFFSGGAILWMYMNVSIYLSIYLSAYLSACLYYTTLYCTLLYYNVLYYTVLCYTTPYYAILNYAILYYLFILSTLCVYLSIHPSIHPSRDSRSERYKYHQIGKFSSEMLQVPRTWELIAQKSTTSTSKKTPDWKQNYAQTRPKPT